MFFPGRQFIATGEEHIAIVAEKEWHVVRKARFVVTCEKSRRKTEERDDHSGSEGGATEEKMKREGPDRIQGNWNSSGPTRK